MSEKLSNLLDKNVEQSDLDEFLRECKRDPSLIDRWQRYNLAGGVLRNEISETDLKFDVASKVMARLETEEMTAADVDNLQSDEDNSNVISLSSRATNDKDLNLESPVSDERSSSSRSSKPWIPLALAASMLLGLYFFFQQPVIETSPQQLADNAAVDTAPSLPLDHWQTSSRDVEDVLNSLLVEHSEFTSVTGMNGLGSYSKFIAYQN